MKNVIWGFAVLLLIGCAEEKSENTMIVKGQIKNLKKGTIYLQKMRDTLMVTADSVVLNGEDVYQLQDQVESPEMYFLSLEKSPEKYLSFFGEPGTIIIDTKLDKFFYAAKIVGLDNQKLLDEYEAMTSQFNNSRLDLIKAEFEARKDGDSLALDSVQRSLHSLERRKYYFATNFAVNHGDMEVSPYIALRDLYNANIRLLDTINNSLAPRVKDSKYGKELAKYVETIKQRN
ncbi:DUF4369 domain-containing protein [Flavobacteriaceae bacterium F08102]|nr:DUF4369 domain-containing protein [Flavobacteriaceae bacterium F08102]